MTVVNVTAALTALGGSEPVTSGRITVEYLRGTDGEPATRAVGAAVTLPAPIVIAIVEGAPVAPVDVPPTDGTCYARIWVECRVPRDAGFLELPAVAIPAAGPVDITALVAVNPASFEPVTTVVAAWQLAVGQVAAMQTDVSAKSAQAVEAAADAGTFAGAADFDADRAGLSAFAAGQSAASALGHKNDAKTSADAAAGSATSAAGSVVAASTERQGAADERLGARQERLDAQTARTGAETARTGAETARTGAETAKTAAEVARDQAQAATFAGTQLTAGVDLNTVGTPGLWFNGSNDESTLARNYPVAGARCSIAVVQNGGYRYQHLRVMNPTPPSARAEWIRRWNGSAWDAWRTIASQRIDKTAGLAIYTWDDVAGREQLIHGDTGWRDITADMLNGATANYVRIRRVGYQVSLVFQNVAPPATSSVDFIAIPSGFRPSTHPASYYPTRPALSLTLQNVLLKPGSPDVVALTLNGYASSHGGFSFGMSWTTTDPWPSTLPGAASGSIPNT